MDGQGRWGVEEERYRNHDAVLFSKTHQLSSGPPLNYLVPHLHCLEPPLNYLGQPLNYLRTARAARRGREGANGLQWGGLGAWAKGTVIGEWCDNGEGGWGAG